MDDKITITENSLKLDRDEDGLFLTDGEKVLRGDFTRMLPRVRKGRWQHELLVKASRLKARGSNLAIDATAGLGEDSILLAAAGYEVVMFEQDEMIAALLEDALERARKDEATYEIAGRMSLVKGNSIDGMLTYKGDKPDIIYLDPMFPARNKSGLIKKKFQLIQRLEKPGQEEEALLDAALKLRPSRVIIKRPAKGPYIADKKADFSYTGGQVRYDCFSFL